MPELTQPWVNELLIALKPKKGFKLSVHENIESRAAAICWEMPSYIAITETGRGKKHTIFQFETRPKVPTFHCDLAIYPELADLVAKLSPTSQYEIKSIIREKHKPERPIEFAGSNLAALIYGR